MTQILLKNAKVIDSGSPHHNKRVDIFIKNGKIVDIGKNLAKKEKVTEIISKNLCVSNGFVDIGTQVCEPGYEIRETMESISHAAFAGGYTTLVPLPNTSPPVQHRSEVEYMINRGRANGLTLYPIAALSKNIEGHDLTEMMDMHAAGAVGFSDGRKPISNSGLLMRALLYVKSFAGIIFDLPSDYSLSKNGHLHEGEVSTKLGMEGIPSLAEELAVQRNLSLLEYTESRLHLRSISAKSSIGLIKDAQKKGLQVSADVSAFHLFFTDEAMSNFDSNKKVFPPFRSLTDQTALKKALKENVFTHISSMHEPLEEERKKLEFPYADFGSIGLESAFAMAHTALENKMDLNDIVEKFTMGPRKILGILQPVIKQGEESDLTIFDPSIEWTFSEESIKSQSKNSAALGARLKGKVLGVVSKNVFIY